MEFSKQEYWNGLPFPTSGDLPDPDIEPVSYIFCIGRQVLASPPCAQLYSTLCDPKDCSLQGSSVHGIFQARILEWVAISYFRGSSQPRDQTLFSCVSYIAGGFFTTEPLGKPLNPWNASKRIFMQTCILSLSLIPVGPVFPVVFGQINYVFYGFVFWIFISGPDEIVHSHAFQGQWARKHLYFWRPSQPPWAETNFERQTQRELLSTAHFHFTHTPGHVITT